jgi:serine/threonine protein kinase
MSAQTRLDEMLLHYEELLEDGAPVAPEALCRDCPELLDALTRGIADLASMDKLLLAPPDHETPIPVAAAELPSIPGFEILEELGRGGMGVVYKARQISLKRLVAVKMILAGSHASPSQQARLRTEAEAVARIRHPHIVQIYDIGTHEGKPFLVLEFVEGISLDKALQAPWLPQDAAHLVKEIAYAVHAAHQAGIVHRDLKPANILLVSGGVVSGGVVTDEGAGTTHHSPLTTHQPKIADFGLAKQLDDGAAQTHSGTILGTPSYMAPEQAAGEIHRIGPWTDVHAMGAILYELLTGRPPFQAESAYATLTQVRSQQPASPRALKVDVPRDLETICLRALHKHPDRRYGSAHELADDLERFLRGDAIQARPDPVLTRVWTWLSRDERIRDAGIVMLVNAAVRTVALTRLVRGFSHLTHVEWEDEPWLVVQVTVWLVGMCVALYWASWRALGRHPAALWAGLCLSVVYLCTRSLSTILEADDERIFLYALLFAAQLLMCLVGLLAYHGRRRP